jgi:hypothetical protein
MVSSVLITALSTTYRLQTNIVVGLGGEDGALVIDLQNLQDFSMDTNTWKATIGAGHKLHDLDQKLHDNGKRAMSHGTCPGVGIGGHATIVSSSHCYSPVCATLTVT